MRHDLYYDNLTGGKTVTSVHHPPTEIGYIYNFLTSIFFLLFIFSIIVA